MYPVTFVIFLVLKVTLAHHPVIFQKDNSVIATEPMKVSLPHQYHKIIPVNYPYYEVVTNPPTVAPTKAPHTRKTDSLPADLIEIAATKLGIKNLDEIPSLSELSELLGTTSREETIETIRELTATESGIDLIKAFIESSDYTDSTAAKEEQPVRTDADTSKPSLPTTFLSETTQKDLEIIQKVLATPQQDLGFFQRVSSYLNIFDLFPENKEIPLSATKIESETENEISEIRPRAAHNKHHGSHHQHHPKLQPISISNRLPISFPIPYRPDAASPNTATSAHRPMKEDRNFPDLKTFNSTLGERFLN